MCQKEEENAWTTVKRIRLRPSPKIKFDGTLWTLDLLFFFNGQPTILLIFPQGSNTGVTFAAAFIFTLIWFLLGVYIEMALQRLGT